MVTDRANSSEFLTHKVVQQYSVPRGKMSSWILAENEYRGKGISSPLMLGGRYTPREWSCSSYYSLRLSNILCGNGLSVSSIRPRKAIGRFGFAMAAPIKRHRLPPIVSSQQTISSFIIITCTEPTRSSDRYLYVYNIWSKAVT